MDVLSKAIVMYKIYASLRFETNRPHKASSVILVHHLANLHVQQACAKDKGFSPLTWMTRML